MTFENIKQYYDWQLSGYDDAGLKIFVKAGFITDVEYKTITGEDYTA